MLRDQSSRSMVSMRSPRLNGITRNGWDNTPFGSGAPSDHQEHPANTARYFRRSANIDRLVCPGGVPCRATLPARNPGVPRPGSGC